MDRTVRSGYTVRIMIIIYPGYSFETLSTDRTADEARQLLSACSAAFHPALLEHCDELPRWESASVPPYDISKQPILIPPCAESYMEDDWFQRQENEGGILIRHQSTLSDMLDELFRVVGQVGPAPVALDHGFDADFVSDFKALGTAYFLTDLLVRQLHYMSMMDDSQCSTQIFNSIRAYRDGNREGAEDYLRQAFDAVCQSKEYFYPIRSNFLDLTLVVPTTLGSSLQNLLQDALRRGKKLNLFLSSRTLRSLLPDLSVQNETDSTDEESVESETLRLFREVAKTGLAQFVFDDTEDRCLALLPILDIAERILEGLTIFQKILNRKNQGEDLPDIRPKIYGRLTTGLNPLLPQLLKLAGVEGVVHFAPLDGWHLKEAAQSKMIWQGADGTKIDALIRYPIAAAADLSFFELAAQLGETINNDQAPTAVFAGFPQTVDRTEGHWLDDLHRMSAYSEDLGDFSSIEHYFEHSAQCGGVKKLDFTQYPDNPLVEAVRAGRTDPISYWATKQRNSVLDNIQSAFETILRLLGRQPDANALVRQLAEFVCQPEDLEDDQAVVDNAEHNVMENAAQITAQRKTSPLAIVLVNPWSFPRRAFVDVSHWDCLPEETGAVVLARQFDGETPADRQAVKEIVVDIPPLGYAFVEPAGGSDVKIQATQQITGQSDPTSVVPSASRTSKTSTSKHNGGLFSLFKKTIFKTTVSKTTVRNRSPVGGVALIDRGEDEIGKDVRRPVFLLRNEHFEIKIDEATGMLRSLFTENSRFNRLSQQIGFRLPKQQRLEDQRKATDPNRGYAISAVDQIGIEQNGPITGRLKIEGRLVCPNGEIAARYTERIAIRRRSRVLEFELELRPEQCTDPQPEASPWDSYFALRRAWNDNMLDLRGCLGDGIFRLDGNRIQSPRFVELRNEKNALTFLSEGLPFHRRFGERQLDTILIAGKETERKFRYAVAVDLKSPIPASLEFLAPKDELIVDVSGRPRHSSVQNPSAWMFQVEARNIVALHWEPVVDGGKALGARIFLLETEGRRAHFALSSFLKPIRAMATDLLGQEVKELKIDDDRVLIDMHGHEILPLVVRFES